MVNMRKKISKKGQIKIQQMAFMLLAIFIFFILVGLFALSFKLTGLKRTATALQEKNALLLTTKLANSPEFACGEALGTFGISNCIDGDKVMALKESISKYSRFWGVNNIIIRKSFGTIECNRGTYNNCDYIDLFSKGTKGISVENFVSLCRKEASNNVIYDKCDLAKIGVYYTPIQ